MEPVYVVAGVVVDRARRKALVARRRRDQHQGDLWEYPGGKREPHESDAHALQRELREELGITVRAAEPLLSVEHSYPDKRVHLQFLVVTAFDGEPHGAEGQVVRWVDVAALSDLAFPAANAQVAGALEAWLGDQAGAEGEPG
ncbi:MAG: 8-oxo-dGTP diphosphatase MutT [Pseudomonadota bacterium]